MRVGRRPNDVVDDSGRLRMGISALQTRKRLVKRGHEDLLSFYAWITYMRIRINADIRINAKNVNRPAMKAF